MKFELLVALASVLTTTSATGFHGKFGHGGFQKMEIVFQPLIGLLVLLQLQLRLPSLLVKTMLVLLELTILVLPKPRPSMKVSPLNTPLIVH